MIGGEWTLLDEDGQTAVNFTSFVSIDFQSAGKVASYPVEKGSFADYNKTQEPLDIRVVLAVQGTPSDFDYTLSRLAEYKNGTVKLSVSTPDALYESMTLETYSYKRDNDSGSGMLTVELTLKEVREVETQVTTTVVTKPKNPTSASKANTGKTQGEDASAKEKSLFANIRDVASGH